MVISISERVQVGYEKDCAAPILRDVIDAHRLPFLPRCAGKKRLRRGVHTSIRQLEADIRTFIDRHNGTADAIMPVKPLAHLA